MNPSAVITPRATGSGLRGDKMCSSPSTPRGARDSKASTPRGDQGSAAVVNSRTPTTYSNSTDAPLAAESRTGSARYAHHGNKDRGVPSHATPPTRAGMDAEAFNTRMSLRAAAMPTRPVLSQADPQQAGDVRGALPAAAFSQSMPQISPRHAANPQDGARAQSSASAFLHNSPRLQIDTLQFHGTAVEVDNDVEEMMRLNAKLKASEARINSLLNANQDSKISQVYATSYQASQNDDSGRMYGWASSQSLAMETSSVPRPIKTPSSVSSQSGVSDSSPLSWASTSPSALVCLGASLHLIFPSPGHNSAIYAPRSDLCLRRRHKSHAGAQIARSISLDIPMNASGGEKMGLNLFLNMYRRLKQARFRDTSLSAV